MEKIILAITSGHQMSYRKVDQSLFEIGRSFECEVILDDPYVAPKHVKLVRGANSWEITDLNSINGLSVNGQNVQSANLASGDEFRIGQTTIRFYYVDHDVAGEKTFAVHRKIASWDQRPLAAWVAFLVLIGLYWAQMLEHVNLDTENKTNFISLIVLLVLMMIWTGIWALVGRVLKHKSSFGTHVIWCSGFLIGVALLGIITMWLGFVFNSTAIFSLVLAFGALAGVYFSLIKHLTVATNLTLGRCKVISGSLILTMSVIISLIYFLSRDTFAYYPPVDSNLKPHHMILAPTYTPKEFVARSENVFKKASVK